MAGGLTLLSGLTGQSTPGAISMLSVKALSQAAAGSIVIPANSFIIAVLIKNNTANAITGGLKVGTTAGGVDVVAALTVGASLTLAVAPAALLKAFFNTTQPQTLFFDAVVAWNSANIDITVIYGQL